MRVAFRPHNIEEEGFMRFKVPFALCAAGLLLAGPVHADDAKIQRKIEERLAKTGLDSSRSP